MPQWRQTSYFEYGPIWLWAGSVPCAAITAYCWSGMLGMRGHERNINYILRLFKFSWFILPSWRPMSLGEIEELVNIINHFQYEQIPIKDCHRTISKVIQINHTWLVSHLFVLFVCDYSWQSVTQFGVRKRAVNADHIHECLILLLWTQHSSS